MMIGATIHLRAAAVALALQQAVAQTCYYPNGNEAPGEKPCSSVEGSACCPDKWECMENGLCYYGPDKLYGRYSCTDKDWKSSGCPSNLCTYDMKAAGAEAVVQCSNHDNNYCCDANRVDVDCCQESPEPRPFFMLQDPIAYGTAGGNIGSSAPNLASITGKATGSDSDLPSSTAALSPSASATKELASSKSSSSIGLTTPLTFESTIVSSDSAGPTTLVVTTVILPPASSTSDSSPAATSEKRSKVPVIVGCAVGIPLALALFGILLWLFRKHRQQKSAPPYTSSTDAITPTSAASEFAGGAKMTKNGNVAKRYESAGPAMSELGGGQGVGPERPISFIPGKAELDSGSAFAPGTVPHSPHVVGVGGGNGHNPQSSVGSVPPEYSPAENRYSMMSGYEQQTSVEGGAGIGAGRKGYATGGYTAYRPPQSQGGMDNVPEMAELPTVRTPPEVVELGGPSPPAVAEMGNPSPPAQSRAEYPGMSQLGTQRSPPN